MGSLMSPVDITSTGNLGELDKRIASGPLTLVFVYADWCGHCQRFKPSMSALESLPNRTIQTARVRDDVFPSSSLNSIPVEGYPTLMLVDTKGNAVNFKDESGKTSVSIPDYKNMTLMNSIVKNAGTPEMVKTLNAAANTVANAPVTPEILNTAAEKEEDGEKSFAQDLESVIPQGPPNTNANRVAINAEKSVLESVTEQPTPVNKPLVGGSLLEFLKQAAYSTGPAIGLLTLATAMKKKTRRRKMRVKKQKKTRKTRGRK